MTGDNFRAACKQPTEQISFSLLNNKDLHSPYGQFIVSLWRGKEDYENIKAHTTDYHAEMKMLMMNGADFALPNGKIEKFNILPIICADLGFVKEILGKCATNGKYGCYYCKKKSADWDIDSSEKGESQTMAQMVLYGEKGRKILGDNPDHNSKLFTDFQHCHLGQYTSPLFDGFEVKYLMPPCGLHLILAHHVYLWSYVI